jgi:hypothetical protein
MRNPALYLCNVTTLRDYLSNPQIKKSLNYKLKSLKTNILEKISGKEDKKVIRRPVEG